MYPKKIYLDYGSGWTDISHCVYYKSITITNRASSDDYHKAQDVASFTLAYHAATFSGIYNATSDIGVYIEDDLSNRLFTGIIPPTMNRTYNGKLDNTTINLEATDSSESLKKEVGDILYEGYKIMDPANKSASIIHQLSYIAGFTDDQIDQTITIDITYDYFSPNNEKDKILEIMDVLLFENGYVFNMNEYDKISPVKWIDDASPAVEFNENNIVEEIEINEQEIEFDAIDLYYYDIGSKDNVRIYTADLPFDEDYGYEGYPVPAGYFWPVEANATDRITGTNKVIYQEYEDVGIKYLTNEAISKGLDYNYKAFDSDFSSIVATKNHVLSPASISGLTTVSGTFGNKKAHVLYKNNTGESQDIYYMHIDATVIYKSTERLLRHGVAVDSERADKYNSYYIFDETSADKLSSNMVQMYKSGNTLYEFESETEAAPGTFAQVVTNDGTDQLCFVLERTYIEEKRMFKYKLKGYNYNEGVIIYEENKKHNTNNLVPDVITVIEEISSTIPDDVTAVSASAFQDSVNLTLTIPQASGVQNGIVGIIVQRSTDGGTNYYDILGNLDGIATVPPGNFQWLFNRSTDGYPEKTGSASPWIALSNYRFRVKGVNAAGVASENWTYSGAPNVDNYKTWLSGTPANGRGTSAQRAVVARVDALGNTVYGYAGCDAQISMNGSDWFEPPSGLDSYASEDNWRQSIEEGSYKRILETQFQTSLPLAGQDDGLSTNTTYYFRFRYVTDRPWDAGSPAGYVESNGLTAGPWTSAITVVAMTGTEEDVLIALSQSYAAAPGILAAYSPKVLEEYPDDPTGTTYINDNFIDADGWIALGGTSLSVDDNKLIMTGLGTSNLLNIRKVVISNGKTVVYKIPYDADILQIDYYNGSAYVPANYYANSEYIIVNHLVSNTDTNYYIRITYASTAIQGTKVVPIEFIYIGTGAYLPGSLRDITGNGYDLNVYSAVPVGEELYFNGVNALLRTKNQVEMPDLFSISGKWVVPSKATTQCLFWAGPGSDYILWYRVANTRTLRIYWRDDVGEKSQSYTDFFPLSDTEAVYIEAGYDFLNDKIYINKNGLKVGEIDATNIIKPAIGYIYFGRIYTGGSYLSGTLSLLCLWNVIHSHQEVLSHYQNPYGAMPKTLVVEQLLAAQARIIKGYMCYLAGGVNDEYNYRVFGNYEDLPVGQAIGENRFGTADKYVHFKPQADDDEADPLIKIMNGSVGLKMYGSVMDFNGTVKADAIVGSTAASTVESNAADGKSAYTGTSVYRNTNIPNGTLTRTQATTVAAANDGSREITLNYNLTALGSLPPDFLVIFYNIGDASQSAPTIATNMGRVTIPISATGAGSYKFTGVPADKYVYFAIGMARNTAGGVKYSSLQNFTQVTPGTVAIGGTATIGGETVNTVVNNAAEGADAFDGTVSYRTPGAPTNNGAFGSIGTGTATPDGNVVINIPYTYTQGAKKADLLLIYIREGGGTVVSSDPAFSTNAVSGSMNFTVKPSTTYTFGIQAVRRTDGGLEGTAITTSVSKTTVEGNYTGKVGGTAAATVVNNAAEGATAYAGTAGYRNTANPDGAFSAGSGSMSQNSDGSINFDISWTFSESGSVPADFLAVLLVTGSSAPGSTANIFAYLAEGTTSYSFKGLPAGTYSAGVVAGRVTNAGEKFTAIYSTNMVNKTAAANVTANINSVAAATVTGNAANGATAYTGTAAYRTTGAPTNNGAFGSINTGTATADGNVIVRVNYTYSQGAKKADFLLMYVRKGGGTVVSTDDCFVITPESGYVDVPVVPSTAYTFGIRACRRTENGTEMTNITTSSQITTVSGDYTGTVGGVSAVNVADNDAWLRAGAPNGSFASHACTVEDNADGTINLNISWTFSQGSIIADRIILVIEKGTSNPGAVGTINDGDTYELPITQTTLKLSGLPSATLDSGTAVKLIYSVGAFAAKPNITGGISVGSVSSPAGWQNKSGTTVAIQIDADNFWNLLTGELKATIGEDKYLHLDPTLEQFILYNILYKTYQGKGVFRRALQIDAHNMDWLNSPVGGTEQLHGRIGRLGPYGPVLLDGPFETNLESTWTDVEVINAVISYYPSYIQLQDGELRIAYIRGDEFLVERVYNFTTSTWGSESVINAVISYYPSYIQLQDGELRIAYTRASDEFLVERVYNFTTSTWGSESVINAAIGYDPSYIQLKDGELRIAYRRGSDGFIVERVYNFTTSTWGSESVINAAIGYYPSYIQLQDGELRIAYLRGSGGFIVERVYNFTTSTWGSESVINAAFSSDPSYIQLQDGELRIAYIRASDGFIVERVYNFTTSTWGSESVINAAIGYDPSYIQLQDGELRIAYRRGSDDYMVERRLQRYARLGAGVIESGHDVTGAVESWWQVFSDGTMDLWQKVNAGDIACTGAWGSLYISAAQSRIYFPVEFDEIHTCEIKVIGSGTGASVVIASSSYAWNDATYQYYLWRATSATLTGVYLSVHAKGKVII